MANQYYQPQPQPQPVRIAQLSTNRGLIKFFLLSIITFGIYGIVVMCGIGSDLNTIASRYDGKKTTHYLLMALILTPITLGIYAFVWNSQLCSRIGNELRRRGIFYSFSAADFWLWCVLGSLLIGIGPLIYIGKMFKAMNLLSEHYNMYG